MKEDEPLTLRQLKKLFEEGFFKADPLNITAKVLCQRIGISYNHGIIKEFIKYGLVEFFTVGNKRLFKASDAEKISELLRSRKIEIRTHDSRYYLTFLE